MYYAPVHTGSRFSDLSSTDLKAIFYSSVNAAFSNIFNKNFPNFIVVYTDGSVFPFSASYAFYIPKIHISFSNNLPPSSSPFTAECYAIIEVLTLVLNLTPDNYLIFSDSLSCLQALNAFNSLSSYLSPLVIRIKSIIFTLNQLNYNIHLDSQSYWNTWQRGC